MSAKQLSLDAIGEQDAATRIGHTAFQSLLARKGDPAYRLTELSLIEAIRPAIEKEFPASKHAKINGRNTLFDALATACGLAEPFTKSAAGQVGKALAEIVEAFPAVDAAEITRVAVAIRKKYENAGPIAVSAHFHEFIRRAKPKATVTAPPGWLAKLNQLYAGSVFAAGGRFEISKETEYAWSQLDAAVRAELMEALL